MCCASADSAASAYAQEQEWYIQETTSDRVHLRAAPDHSAESLGLYFQRTTVERKKIISARSGCGDASEQRRDISILTA